MTCRCPLTVPTRPVTSFVGGLGSREEERGALGTPGFIVGCLLDAQIYPGKLFFFSLTSRKITTQFILTSDIKTFV